MAKRSLYVVVAVILASAGLYFMAKDARSARTQVAAIQSQDVAADPLAAVTVIKSYVANHMGTSATFTLTGSYNRALAAATAAQAAAAANANVYAAAQAACSGKTDSITQAKCNAAYLAAHLQGQPAAAPVSTPVLATYQYNLHAPIWTPDLAGAMLLGAVAALGLLVFNMRTPRRRHR